MTMDEELRRALRRVEPPAGFANRVLQLVSTKPPQAAKSETQVTKAGKTALVRFAIAATLVAAIGGGLWYRADERQFERRQQAQQGEAARRQVLLSLSIAGTKLRSVQLQINHGEER